MDTILEPLWCAGHKPFHGETIFSSKSKKLPIAIKAIESAFNHIQLYYPSNQLMSFDDWHEHDGFIYESRPISLEVLREQISSPEEYVKHHSDDYAVYRAIYPDSLDFILRYCLWSPDEQSQSYQSREADISFTGYGFDISEIKKRWFAPDFLVESSQTYFKERYGG